jgi:hypothetical protein
MIGENALVNQHDVKRICTLFLVHDWTRRVNIITGCTKIEKLVPSIHLFGVSLFVFAFGKWRGPTLNDCGKIDLFNREDWDVCLVV